MEKDIGLALNVLAEWINSIVYLPIHILSIMFNTITLPLRFFDALFS